MAKVKFKSEKELKNEILKRIKKSVEYSHETAMQVAEGYVDQYYEEYEPKIYDRTYQLGIAKRSFVDKGALHEIKVHPSEYSNGYKSLIMFMSSAMNHNKKWIRGKNGKLYVYDNNGWSEEKILHEAMVGETHGGYKAAENTPIWTCTLGALNGDVDTNLVSRMIRDLEIKGSF